MNVRVSDVDSDKVGRKDKDSDGEDRPKSETGDSSKIGKNNGNRGDKTQTAKGGNRSKISKKNGP